MSTSWQSAQPTSLQTRSGSGGARPLPLLSRQTYPPLRITVYDVMYSVGLRNWYRIEVSANSLLPRQCLRPCCRRRSRDYRWGGGGKIDEWSELPENISDFIRLDAWALSVIATATWLGGWLAGWLSHSGTVSTRLNLSENFFDVLKGPSF